MIREAINQATGQLRKLYDQEVNGASYPVAIYKLTVDGTDISNLIAPRLISLDLTDNRGLEADQLSIVLSDHDGLLAIPPRGAKVRLWLGWNTTGLVDKGTYIVDETEHSGAPDVLSIRARSADLRKTLKAKRDAGYTNTTLGTILRTIATRQGLTPVIAKELDTLQVLQLDQTGESDANLLTRLGEDHDAVATIKAGRLIFIQQGKGKTASGADLGHITLTREDGDQHSYLQADRESYEGVRAYYYDVNSAKKQHAIAGGGDNLKDLRHTYSDQASALRAARAEWNRLQRGTATLTYQLALGRPDLIPELSYTLMGVKAEIDAIIWHGGNVQHSLTADGGYTTRLDLEAKLPEDLVSDLFEEVQGDYTGVIAYYRDKATGKEVAVTAGDQTKPKRLHYLYASKHTAKRAVEREWKKLQEAKAAE
ncbi:phage late control D family protein [Pseudomonas luteola]|uniref:phage late control D family protein n=1 Tax=Pseudomonas luteola TaxID=47886 RepID=UPI001EF5A686|nr:phage late control D family protein [Pseudomonas luteola]MCG7375220.1 phage late control D family protein [Pseudomonas luteola]